MKVASLLASAACAAVVTVFAVHAQPAPPDRDLGRVSFPTSARPEAQAHFLRGVAWLHSFGYEDAFEEFEKARTIDPESAMAVWGEAMTFSQPVWGTEDLVRGRLALSQLGTSRLSRLAKAPTAREKAYIDAVEILYGDGDKHTRDVAYADAMSRLWTRYPDDVEAACFYALALLGTMHRGDDPDALDSGTDRHAHALAGSETQARVAALLQKVFAAHPDHPGAAHYLIHALDDPEHAAQALEAARAYAKSAPASSHALHMPAHVFLQLGRWEEASSSDKASFDASVERVKRRGLSMANQDFHSLSWLMYEYLQQGRYRDAQGALDLIQPAVDQTGDPRVKNTQASMRARYAIETRRWDEMRARPNYFNADELGAIGMSAARAGDLDRAEQSRQRLADIGASDRMRVIKPLVLIMERQLAGLIALSAGRPAEAIADLEDAIAREDGLPPPVGWPQPAKPAHELLGEVLLEEGRASEAAVQFALALRRSPNRALSVLGLARAKARLGETEAARTTYRTFLANWRAADAELPQPQEARAFTEVKGSQVHDSTTTGLGVTEITVVMVLLGAAAVGIVVARRWKRVGEGRVPRAPARRNTPAVQSRPRRKPTPPRS